MSQLGSTDKGTGIPVSKPRPDIYTVLLGLSLAAILIAILCLVLELGRYNWDWKASSAKFSMTRPTPNQLIPSRPSWGMPVEETLGRIEARV
jgi:hypothetical protein